MVNRRQWPDKTIDRAQFVCTFERSDWRFGRSKLKFYDLPGERIADAAMAGMDFPAWSDHVIRLLTTDLAYRQHAEEYLRALDERRPQAEILAAYRLTLARLIKAYKPYISPSTFYLDTRGGHGQGRRRRADRRGAVQRPGRRLAVRPAVAGHPAGGRRAHRRVRRPLRRVSRAGRRALVRTWRCATC
jgi:hypothetical protein